MNQHAQNVVVSEYVVYVINNNNKMDANKREKIRKRVIDLHKGATPKETLQLIEYIEELIDEVNDLNEALDFYEAEHD